MAWVILGGKADIVAILVSPNHIRPATIILDLQPYILDRWPWTMVYIITNVYIFFAKSKEHFCLSIPLDLCIDNLHII